jgi:predicted P-loop ATPase
MKLTGLNFSKTAVSLDKVTEIKEFLNEHYEIKVNEFDPNKSVVRSKSKIYLNPITFDDISLHLLEEEIAVSDSVLRKILRSPNHIASYNPIAEYFTGLEGKYKGVSHIDLLMSHLRMREYTGKKQGYYQDRFYVYMKKWYVATVACALGLHPNDVAMGLIHSEEGIGKSFFFNFIVPKPLHNMIADPSDNGKFNLQESFARYFLVYFDELFGINRKNEDEFKKALSASEIDVYLPREPQPFRRKRIGSACFTSNRTPEKGGFLTPNMSYRRWLILELDSINRDYSIKVDVDQIWAEAVLLLNQDFNYKWDAADWAEFKEHNQRYLKATTSSQYIKSYFDIPTNGEGSWLQPKEILHWLNSNRKIRGEDRHKVSEEKIGEALTNLSYEKKNVRKPEGVRNCYYVKFLS